MKCTMPNCWSQVIGPGQLGDTRHRSGSSLHQVVRALAALSRRRRATMIARGQLPARRIASAAMMMLAAAFMFWMPCP
jgi:hypothetical protein